MVIHIIVQFQHILEGNLQNKCKKRLEIVQGVWRIVEGFGGIEQRDGGGAGCGGGKPEAISWIVYRMFIEIQIVTLLSILYLNKDIINARW